MDLESEGKEPPKVISMPTIVPKTPPKKRNLDLDHLGSLFELYAPDIRFLIIEDVHSMPHDGHVGAFSFGKGFGIILGLAAAHKIPTLFVQPAVWKSNYGLGRVKSDSILKAKMLFNFETKKDGMAESLLIAHFGKRFL